MRFHATMPLLAVLVLAACADESPFATPDSRTRAVQTATSVRFAVIGDFGLAGTAEADVAKLVKSWNPDHIITVGDNNYENGAASTIDANIGQYYSSFIYPYKGSYGTGATTNRFWPSLGNHEYKTSGATPYLNYFTLPGNERYYEVRQGPVHFFAINSNFQEPSGITSSSAQATWLKNALAASTAPWKVVFFHHSPYSSGMHGDLPEMQWPFPAWGAHIVLTGHDHLYERLSINGFPYIVNGLGGRSRYSWGTFKSASVIRYNSNFGAQLVDATDQTMTLKFYTRSGSLIDSYTMNKSATPTPTTGGTISFQNGALPTSSYAGNIDMHISQNNTTSNYGSSSTLLVDGDDPVGTGRDKRTILRWDVSAIASTKTVTGATITLNVTNVSNQAYELYQLNRSATESDATWANYASGAAWSTAGAGASTDRGTTSLGRASTASALGKYTITLNSAGIALVQGWVNGTIPNYGIIILDGANTDGADFSSSETGTVANRPMLTVTYR